MPERNLVVAADQTALPLDLVTQTLADADRVLADVERGVSRQDQRVGEVLIENVNEGSIALQVRYQARSERYEATVARAAQAFVVGLAALPNATTPPPYFSSSSLRTLRRMADRMRAVPGAHLVVSNGGAAARAIVDTNMSQAVEEVLSVRHEALGSVMGTLEAISIHGRRIARVYPDDRSGAVECAFPHELTAQVHRAFGHRVIATGVVHRTATGDPLRLELREVATLPSAGELPSIDDLIGIDPDFAGGLTGEDYVSQQRR